MPDFNIKVAKKQLTKGCELVVGQPILELAFSLRVVQMLSFRSLKQQVVAAIKRILLPGQFFFVIAWSFCFFSTMFLLPSPSCRQFR